MLSSIFVMVLNMSITAACMTAVLLLLRPMLTRLPRVFSRLLWLVVLLRLLCPFSLTAGFSLLGVWDDGAQASTPVAVSGQELAASSMQWAPPLAATPNTALQLLTVVWLGGVAVMLLFYLRSLLRLKRRVAGAEQIGSRVYRCDNVESPFVFGLFRPAIYLPTCLAEQDISFVIKHENTHIKRFDHIVKLVAFTALCLHWFNPLVWLSVVLLNRDIEISCDEKVLAGLQRSERKSYSLLLLDMAADSGMGVGATSFGENDIKMRIKNILNYKQIAPRWWWAAAALSVVLVAVLMTNPASEPPLEPVAQSLTPALSVEPVVVEPPAAAPQPIEPPVAPSEADPQPLTLIWPVDGGFIASGIDAYPGHTGVDIYAPHGTDIYAAQDGIVTYAVNHPDGAYGKRVDIDHGDGWITRYAHCSEVLVEEGDTVKQGQLIAKVGDTGNAYGKHCHFEVHYYDDLQDPEDYIGSKAPDKKADVS